MFKDRTEAAYLLAEKLKQFKNRDGVVLAVPRGGVPIGKIIAEALNLPLEIVLSKKIGHPVQKEYAIGAVSLETRVLNDDIEVPEKYIEDETRKIRELLRERYKKYYQGRIPISLVDKIVVIVDDGIATGYTIETTIDLVRQHHPKKVVVAVPVAPPKTIQRLEASDAVDEVICLSTPFNFYAVGQYYESFPQVTDDEVIEMMKTYGKSNKGKNASSKVIFNKEN